MYTQRLMYYISSANLCDIRIRYVKHTYFAAFYAVYFANNRPSVYVAHHAGHIHIERGDRMYWSYGDNFPSFGLTVRDIASDEFHQMCAELAVLERQQMKAIRAYYEFLFTASVKN